MIFFRSLAQGLPRLWYQRRLAVGLLPLLPLSWLFQTLLLVRRALYHCRVLPSMALPVPVIVVGNLTVGGSGKTPLVLWLVERLRECGWQPGIISRGYGATIVGTHAVTATSTPADAGDEPVLLARRSALPVFVGRDRVASGRALCAAHPECNVIVADDGLQHYRLQRCVELVVFDGRGAGNACLLPAGPLREPLSRLDKATALVWNGCPDERAAGAAKALPQFSLRLAGRRFIALKDRACSCDADDLRGKTLHAIAGIGDPQRFFASLGALGLEFTAHPFPDHHRFSAGDLVFAANTVLLMTEKDAVKCAALPVGEAWVLPVDALVDAAADGAAGLLEIILEKLDGCTPA